MFTQTAWILAVVLALFHFVPQLNMAEQAGKAYNDKRYAESAQLFDSAFAAGLKTSDTADQVAYSYALAGNQFQEATSGAVTTYCAYPGSSFTIPLPCGA